MGSLAAAERSIDPTVYARLSLATASIAAGLIHASVVPHHVEESTILGAAFVATAILQIAWAAPASVRLDARTLDLGVAVNAAVVAAWIASRTIGLPFGPHAWVAEPVGASDAAATVLELLIVSASTLLRVSQPDRGLHARIRGVSGGARHGPRDLPKREADADRAVRSSRARTSAQRAPRSSETVREAADQAQRLAPPMGSRLPTMAYPAGRQREGSLRDPIAILFDVDGTLISTGGAGTRSWRWAFEELHGIPADIGDYSEAGMTDPVVGRSTFRNVLHRDPTGAEMRSLLAAYLERLPTEVQASDDYRVLPGAEHVLRSLHGTGHATGIVTGALEKAARAKLARGDLNRFLSFGGFGSDSADRIELTRRAIERGAALIRRELPPERVHVIGDTPRDMEAAAAVGAVPVGVTTGTYGADALKLAGAKIVFATLEAYPALLH